MLTYIVEDDPLKSERLSDFLIEKFPFMTIQTFMSYQTGLKAIGCNPPDLVILDMTLPTFDRSSARREGRIRPLGGYELMRKLSLHGSTASAIVVTQLDAFGEGDDKQSFGEIDKKCKDELPHIYRAGIYFGQADLAWQDELFAAIQKVLTK